MKLIWILIGLIAGSSAKMMTNPGHGGRWIFSLGIGVIGAVVLGFIGQVIAIDLRSYGDFIWPIIGSLISLFIYHRFLRSIKR